MLFVIVRKNERAKVSKDSKVARKKNKNSKKKERKAPFWFGIRTRTSPHRLFEVIKKLTKRQKNIVRKMGFGKLLTMGIEKITAKLAHYIVLNFNPETMEIELGDKKIMVDKEAISQLLGFPCGSLIISENERLQEREHIVNVWKSRYPTFLVSTFQIGAKIIENDYNEEILFKIDFLMLVITTLIESNQNGTCKYQLLDLLRMENNFGDYDWCAYTMDALRGCKKNWKPYNVNSHFVGPLTFLVLLYLDSLTCEGMDNERVIPPIAYWDKDRMERRQNQEIKNGGFGLGQIRDRFEDNNSYDIESEEENEVKESDEKSLEKYLASLSELCKENAEQKLKLEEKIKDFKRKFPNSNEVVHVIEEYQEIYSEFLEFKDEDEDGESNDEESDDEGSQNDEGKDEEDKRDTNKDEGNDDGDSNDEESDDQGSEDHTKKDDDGKVKDSEDKGNSSIHMCIYFLLFTYV
ncbi:hypothetical protein HanPI659440_Chr14g0563721 [Helianthus annuus]|nr:hypothetical protein HanPI659440_Chr14g0563721 [Helianthus annuus]